MLRKTRILVFSDYYTPGYKTGGPIQALVNQIDHCKDRYEFWVVTKDRDLNEKKPYQQIMTNKWQQLFDCNIIYLTPWKRNIFNFRRLISQTEYDILYLNSFFSVSTVLVMLLNRMGLLPKKPIILAPRGQMFPEALYLKRWKKKLFMFVANLVQLNRSVFYQATNKAEQEIFSIFFPKNPILFAPDLPPKMNTTITIPKTPLTKRRNAVRFIFLSRISPIKNLDYAIESLQQIAGEVVLDIYGPIEDSTYWKQCKKLQKNLPDNVSMNYIGELRHDEIANTFMNYHFLLFPTKSENFGHVIQEALIAGCPVIISDQTPWRFLKEKNVGWDLPLSQKTKFIDIIQSCVAMDSVEYEQMSKSTFNYGLTLLRSKEAVEQTLTMFELALNNKLYLETTKTDVPHKPNILVFSDYFSPGYKAGGPIQTLVNQIGHCKEWYNFFVVTKDRDLGDTEPYPGIVANQWHQMYGCNVIYLPPSDWGLFNLKRIIATTDHDILYLNSFFSVSTIKIKVAKRLGLLPKKPIILAPRGQLFADALDIKRRKKQVFMFLANQLRLYHTAYFQATNNNEQQTISKLFKKNPILFASNLPPKTEAPDSVLFVPPTKQKNLLRLIFLARVSRIKNLDYAIEILQQVNGEVVFDVYGPIEDAAYWEQCKKLQEGLPGNVLMNYVRELRHDEIAGTFPKYHFLFLPTKSENFGHIIQESLIAGCPVIISNQTPWRSLNEKNIGWDLPLSEKDKFLETIQKCVAMDAAEYEPMSKSAYEYGLALLSNLDAVNQNRRMFEMVLNKRTGAR